MSENGSIEPLKIGNQTWEAWVDTEVLVDSNLCALWFYTDFINKRSTSKRKLFANK